MAGFEFAAIPKEFIVHYPHKSSAARELAKTNDPHLTGMKKLARDLMKQWLTQYGKKQLTTLCEDKMLGTPRALLLAAVKNIRGVHPPLKGKDKTEI